MELDMLRDRESKFNSQKQVLGTGTGLRYGLSFRTREHREKLVRKKKSKNMLGLHLFWLKAKEIRVEATSRAWLHCRSSSPLCTA